MCFFCVCLRVQVQHILGDMISPPLIGAVSDATSSLRQGLQVTWIAVLVSGAAWGLGAGLLPPLPTSQPRHHSKNTYGNCSVKRHRSHNLKNATKKTNSSQYTSTGDGAKGINGDEDEELGGTCNDNIRDGSSDGSDDDDDNNDNDDKSNDESVPTFWALLCAREPDFDEGHHPGDYKGAQVDLELLDTATNPLAYSGHADFPSGKIPNGVVLPSSHEGIRSSSASRGSRRGTIYLGDKKTDGLSNLQKSEYFSSIAEGPDYRPGRCDDGDIGDEQVEDGPL